MKRVITDLLHLIENTFDRKNIHANPSSLTLKRHNVFELTKWRHFLSKCTDTFLYRTLACETKLNMYDAFCLSQMARAGPLRGGCTEVPERRLHRGS